MPIAAPAAGDRILNTDLGAFYNLLKGVAASGEAITLVYNAAGVIAFIPSSDPAASTQLFQIKNAASTVKSALTAGGGALFSSQVNFAKGSDIASAGTTDLSTITGNYAQVSGTTTITAFGTVQAGTVMVLEFQGILTLTHNATSLILRSGANATTAAGDVYIFVSEGSGNWREISHLTPTVTTGITIAAEQATTSGTSKDFTGIPAGTKRITVMLVGVSTNGTQPLSIQLGDSGGVETSGYLSAVTDTGGAPANNTSAFQLATTNAAASVWHGQIVLSLEDSSDNTWVESHVISKSDSAFVAWGAGSKALSPGPLDRVRINNLGGDTFDAGVVSISYE